MSQSRVYTHRFLACFGAGATATWTCPAGKRAVVTSLLVSQTGANVGLVQVVVGPIVAFQRTIQAFEATSAISMRAVAYTGEEIYAHTGVAGLYVGVNGFLFEDPENLTGPPAGAGSKPNPEPLESTARGSA